jgi:hypothetical protein
MSDNQIELLCSK